MVYDLLLLGGCTAPSEEGLNDAAEVEGASSDISSRICRTRGPIATAAAAAFAAATGAAVAAAATAAAAAIAAASTAAVAVAAAALARFGSLFAERFALRGPRIRRAWRVSGLGRLVAQRLVVHLESLDSGEEHLGVVHCSLALGDGHEQGIGVVVLECTIIAARAAARGREELACQRCSFAISTGCCRSFRRRSIGRICHFQLQRYHAQQRRFGS